MVDALKRHPDAALIVLLVAMTAVVLGKDISVGGLRHGDSAAHAMDGVLIHDWIAGGPVVWGAPMSFALDQYAHYPTLGIGRHYPPGFAMVEASFFAVLGVSPFSARASVVFFGLLAAAGAYVYLRSFTDRFAAVLGVIALLLMPATTRWGRQVMLELPTLAILIWVAVVLSRYLEKPSRGRLGCVLAVAVVALLFKQTAVFLLGAVTITLLVGACRRAIPLGHGVLVLVAWLVIVALVAVSLDGHGGKLLRGDASFDSRWSWSALSFYVAAIPRQVGLLVLVAAGVGVMFLRRVPLLHGVFLASWMVVCYVMLVLADYKNARFFYLALFPFAACAGVGTSGAVCLLRSERGRVVLCGFLVIFSCGLALCSDVEHRPDYGSIVRANADRIEGRAVLFSGLRDGDFVFAVRQHLPWRSAVVIRGSKLLYTCNGRPDLDFVTHVSSREALSHLMDRFAFRSVFVERENKMELAEDQYLREYLDESDVYRCEGVWRFQRGAVRDYRDITIEAYEAVRSLRRHEDHFDLLIPRTGRTIRVDLSRWS